MSISHKCQAVALLPIDKQPAATPSANITRPRSQQQLQHPKHSSAHQIPPCRHQFPSQIYMVSSHQSRKYASWPGLTHIHANKYFPDVDKSLKGNMVQSIQDVRSTKPCINTSATEYTPSPPTSEPFLSSEELHIWE